MRYKISAQIEIRTENAAKPASQSSAHLVGLLDQLPRVQSSFDYGCGKLRYYEVMSAKTETLVLVDSEIQLSREQMIRGSRTTIRDCMRGSNRVSVYNEREFLDVRSRFDRGFCINVLSVVPFYSVRHKLLESIYSKLRVGGTCLFVTQYRNSDFTRMSRMSNASPYKDGFLINSLRGYSFYALIRPEKLDAMLNKAGFQVVDTHLNEGSVYTWVMRV